MKFDGGMKKGRQEEVAGKREREWQSVRPKAKSERGGLAQCERPVGKRKGRNYRHYADSRSTCPKALPSAGCTGRYSVTARIGNTTDQPAIGRRLRASGSPSGDTETPSGHREPMISASHSFSGPNTAGQSWAMQLPSNPTAASGAQRWSLTLNAERDVDGSTLSTFNSQLSTAAKPSQALRSVCPRHGRPRGNNQRDDGQTCRGLLQ
ncbi:hypothetical protein DTO027B5_1648 [Paecilomyces variotii]|nr:hypothetical protein DTO032I3_7796 [Paecilomyces variotii]KAJ9235103.1 hypothetical protein DTO169E5_6319 [Paecilomyces variotii]KAJ9250685.1 hypothetical protein DTO207G8_5870 [Paecilomyces variotii]KAJ9278543.1 hypothetical protein DTO021D3_4741 [Paecilomyces variotii]KAJ9323947.1 hypothetical protein DTO027B3_5028 [Paecilomyces variotii]